MRIRFSVVMVLLCILAGTSSCLPAVATPTPVSATTGNGMKVEFLAEERIGDKMNVYLIRVNEIPCIVFNSGYGLACDCDFTKGRTTPGGDITKEFLK